VSVARRWGQVGRLLARRLGRGSKIAEQTRCIGMHGRGIALCPGRPLDRRHGGFGFLLGGIGGARRLAPAHEDQPPFRDADALAQAPIALGRLGLAAQRGGAMLHVGQEFVEPDEVGLGGPQLGFGILSADMEPGDAGGFLQHLPPLGRPRGDDLRDLALADQSGRMRAGGRVREQQGDILGPHVPAVDPVGRARAALNPAGYLHLARPGELEIARQVGLAPLDQQGDFGEVAGGAGGGAGEDHVVHAGAAHRFGARFAHHPADRFQHVGFAAAVRPDDAGQARFDPQFSGFDEGFEP
jgi:hypothetical protein